MYSAMDCTCTWISATRDRICTSSFLYDICTKSYILYPDDFTCLYSSPWFGRFVLLYLPTVLYWQHIRMERMFFWWLIFLFVKNIGEKTFPNRLSKDQLLCMDPLGWVYIFINKYHYIFCSFSKILERITVLFSFTACTVGWSDFEKKC